MPHYADPGDTAAEMVYTYIQYNYLYSSLIYGKTLKFLLMGNTFMFV